METTNIHEAKLQLSKLVERALAGEEVIIARAGKPVVRLVTICDNDAAREADLNRFLSLPVTIPHALAVFALPDYHRDPFDRMLIAQALHEGFRLVTRDQEIANYPVVQILA